MELAYVITQHNIIFGVKMLTDFFVLNINDIYILVLAKIIFTSYYVSRDLHLTF